MMIVYPKAIVTQAAATGFIEHDAVHVPSRPKDVTDGRGTFQARAIARFFQYFPFIITSAVVCIPGNGDEDGGYAIAFLLDAHPLEHSVIVSQQSRVDTYQRMADG